MSVQAQRTFMQNGGIYAGILQAKYDAGELVPPEKYEWQEYPKMLRISRGTERVVKTTLRIRGKEEIPYEWEEDVEVFDDIIVNSEAEEERVLNGGKSDAQVEEERQDLLTQCKQRGITADASWPLFRLQQALGAAPTGAEVETLRAKVAHLEEVAALKAKIAELEGRGSQAPDEAEQIRVQLRELGIEPDGRWGLPRLRQELEAATAP